MWGDDPTYTVGAIKNAELAKTVYPGWECWYYVGTSVPEDVTLTLSGMDNCRVFEKETAGNWDSMFWRFEAASGGMWGARGDVVKHMAKWIKAFLFSIESSGSNYWQVDQDFLKQVIYPKVKEEAFVNDSGVYEYEPFPTLRKEKYFVGQAFDEHDNPLHPEHMDMIVENF